MIYIRYKLLKYFIFVSVTTDSWSNHGYSIYIFNFITFLIQFLLWRNTLHCWKNCCHKQCKSIFMFIWIQPFLIIHVNTTMHAYTINYYCFCRHYSTVCALQVISFFFLIRSTIIGNSEVILVGFFNEYIFCMIWLIPYFQCNHIHT